MNTTIKISRRGALKCMGTAIASGVIKPSGLLLQASCSVKRNKRIIFYFIRTGNCLHVAHPLSEKDLELSSIPQMMKYCEYGFKANKIELVYSIYGRMLPYMVQKIIANINEHCHWSEPVTEEERAMHMEFIFYTNMDSGVGALDENRETSITHGNYELVSQGVKTQSDCEFCFACIQNCPQKAIQFAKNESCLLLGRGEANPNADIVMNIFY